LARTASGRGVAGVGLLLGEFDAMTDRLKDFAEFVLEMCLALACLAVTLVVNPGALNAKAGPK